MHMKSLSFSARGGRSSRGEKDASSDVRSVIWKRLQRQVEWWIDGRAGCRHCDRCVSAGMSLGRKAGVPSNVRSQKIKMF